MYIIIIIKNRLYFNILKNQIVANSIQCVLLVITIHLFEIQYILETSI